MDVMLDPFWKEFKYHDLIIELWDEISRRYADKGSVLAAYDLLNEPEVRTEVVKESPEIPIFVGEFSCPRWTGNDGNRYLQDVIQIAEENDWSWAYHSFRESHIQ